MQTICCEVVTHEYTQTHKDVCLHKYQDYHQIEFFMERCIMYRDNLSLSDFRWVGSLLMSQKIYIEGYKQRS